MSTIDEKIEAIRHTISVLEKQLIAAKKESGNSIAYTDDPEVKRISNAIDAGKHLLGMYLVDKMKQYGNY